MLFHEIQTPSQCQAECRRDKSCKFFTFNFVEGCFLFKGRIPDMALRGKPKDLIFGSVSGPRHCDGTR